MCFIVNDLGQILLLARTRFRLNLNWANCCYSKTTSAKSGGQQTTENNNASINGEPVERDTVL